MERTVYNLPQFCDYLEPISLLANCWMNAKLNYPLVFYWSTQYHQHLYWGGRCEGVESHKVAGRSSVKAKNSQIASFGAIFSYIQISYKAKFVASVIVVIYSQLSD